MLLKAKPKPQMTWISQNRPELVTPYSLTLVLAYLQYYTPKRLQNGRFLPIEHLRNLANWINYPAPQTNALPQHKILSMHLALLSAAQFISVESSHIMPQPAVTRWLHLPHQEAVDALLSTINDLNQWQRSVASLNLENVLRPDSHAYLQQSLTRQREQEPTETPQNAHWLESEEDIWHLHIPQTLPRWLQFDLRQLGDGAPHTTLICTPLTIAAATQHGYTPETITWLLETATQEQLSRQHSQQLQQWSRRAHAYQVQSVQLLSTAQPDQMDSILRQKRLRKHVITHLSPRHAIVSSALLPPLQKWLATQQIPLKQHQPTDEAISTQPSIKEETAVQWSEQTSVQWLGTRILIGLSDLTHQPIPSPHTLLKQLDSQLDPHTRTELEAIAANMLNGLRDAIRGRDAFLPSQQPVSPETIALIQKAIWNDTALHIQYQQLGSRQPTWREVQPLRLEQRGALYYLTAYCLRAETNITFRLDRIHNIEI